MLIKLIQVDVDIRFGLVTLSRAEVTPELTFKQ